ncbi:MAG TPA: glucose-1-phosphate adenylyltransferase, partial [Candidatus Hydrogenedentes bacterium]|nr:glucose-1-phosphate adenylyltransferase [Candidatus Hydrogenedentota bacterium]
MDRVCAIVLGGGRGSRLYPLTALRAKPAVPLLGRYRLIDIPLSNCIHSAIRRIFVLTQFNSGSLNRHVNSTYQFDRFSKGFVDVLAAEQTIESGDWYQGTADAVRQHLHRLRALNAGHILVLSGDQLYRMDYGVLMANHLRTKADITVATLPVSKRDAHGFGIMKIRRDGRITDFVEKPTREKDLNRLAVSESASECPGHRQWLASMGIYVFRSEVLDEILTKQPAWIDFGKEIIPNSIKNVHVHAHRFEGFWEDIGTVRSYYETHMRMVKPHPPFEFYDPRRIIYTHPRYLPGARLQDSHVQDSIVCEGCRISKAKLSEVVVGIRSVINPGVTISKSIVMGADFLEDRNARSKEMPVGIGKNTSISGAIIDKNARIGERVVIRGSRDLPDQDGEGWAIRDGLV